FVPLPADNSSSNRGVNNHNNRSTDLLSQRPVEHFTLARGASINNTALGKGAPASVDPPLASAHVATAKLVTETSNSQHYQHTCPACENAKERKKTTARAKPQANF